MGLNQKTNNDNARAPGTAEAVAPEASLMQVLWRRRWVAMLCFLLAMGGGGAYLLLAPKIYTSTARVYVMPVVPRVVADSAAPPGQISENFWNMQCEVINSAPILALALGRPGIQQSKTFDGERNPLTWLKKNLQTTVGKKDDIISVSLNSRYPQEAAEIVNAIVDSYIAYQSHQRRARAEEMLGILSKAKAERDNELHKKAIALTDFRKANGMVGLDGQRGNIMAQRLTTLGDALTAAQVAALDAEAHYREVVLNLAPDLRPGESVDTVDNSAYGTPAEESLLRAELFRQEQQLQDLRRRYMEDHPICRASLTRVRQLAAAYVLCVKQQWASAQRKQAALKVSYDAVQKEASQINALATEYARLENDLQQEQRMVESLANRMKEINLNEGGSTMDISVIEAATLPEKPSSPSKVRTLVLAMALGLAFGMAGALARQALDQKFYSLKEIQDVIGTQVLGAIPCMNRSMTPAARALRVYLDPTSPTAECFRTIRTTLQYKLSKNDAKIIMVASAGAEEGRSTCIANLAIAMAQSGSKVLIVDADLHNPVQHKLFSVSPATGLSNLLSGQQPAGRAIRNSNIMGLDVLPAGQVQSNPAELLNDQALADLLGDLAAKYDCVLVDSPAITRVNDARIIAATCDATVFLIHAGRAGRKQAMGALEGLWSVGANVMGVIVNEFKEASDSNTLIRRDGQETNHVEQNAQPHIEIQPHVA